MATTVEIQKRLVELGYDPGPVDGARGRRTRAAIKKFQTLHNLEADGIVGKLTMAALWPNVAPPKIVVDIPWFEEAQRLKGLREGKGNADNPIILDWADDLDLHYPHDSAAWCGLFVAHCISATLPDEVLPSNPLGARNFLDFGQKCQPTLGCILVFWREQRNGWKGHVALYLSEDATTFTVLGGNQGDSVSTTRVSKDRLLGARWPTTVPLPETRVVTGGSGSVSTNEA